MVRLLLVALVVAIVFLILSRSYRFKMRFAAGELVYVRGTIGALARQGFVDVARTTRITGTVTSWHGRNLRFSASIAEGDRQRFRNLFCAHHVG